MIKIILTRIMRSLMSKHHCLERLSQLLVCAFFCVYAPLSNAIDPYTNRELESLQKDFLTEINHSPQVLRAPLAVTYLNQLGQRLAHAGHMNPATFFIVNSPDLNAFAGPGGYIGIYTTLIITTHTEDELAAVMAHELAHVKLHHLYDMIEHEKLMRIPTAASLLAAIALGTINPMLGTGALAATLSGAAQHSINYTRAHEKEADRIGMQMLVGAGFNPHAMSHFFNKMHQEMRYNGADLPALLRTHPLDEERMAEAEDRAAHLPTPPQADPLNYALFKEFIRNQMVNQPKALIEYYEKHLPAHPLAHQYGLALAHLEANQPEIAAKHLTPLLTQAPTHPFLLHAKALIALGQNHPSEAITTLQQANTLLPSMAMQRSLAEAYLADHDPNHAAKLLTKAFRQDPKDLQLCLQLARTESENHRTGYAYFIQAQCDSLQGQHKVALRRLKEAARHAKHDAYLRARIEAKSDEIQEILK